MKKRKEEKGSITLFVLVACMFFITILLLVNIGLINKRTNQEKELAKISKTYNVTQNQMADTYNNIVDKNRYPNYAEIQEMIDKAVKIAKEETREEMQQKIESSEATINGTINSTKTGLENSINEAKTELKNGITMAKTQTKLETFPVGSIFVSTTPTNPSSYIGGTWESYGQGRTLIGAGTGTDSNNTSQLFKVGATGGEYTHTLTVAEMPSHAHIFSRNYVGTGYTGYANRTLCSVNEVFGGNPPDVKTGYTGGNGAHNNLQPYIVTYLWKRTA